MRFNRLKMSYRSQNLLGQLKAKTGLTPNISGRFALCLSLKDPSIPNPDEFDERGSEIHPQVLFGDYENVFLALFIQRLKKDRLDPELYLNKMLRAHFNRGAIALYSRINDLSDFYPMIKHERSQ
ncbi:MAG TPA: DNA sulfur modification protein DndE [Candidatus Nitrosotenuis sp.]|nr:DNA sulfur modification protein DndE [Candidatus Nitrosotenuis sp.]